MWLVTEILVIVRQEEGTSHSVRNNLLCMFGYFPYLINKFEDSLIDSPKFNSNDLVPFSDILGVLDAP